jgi:hypothetical protein
VTDQSSEPVTVEWDIVEKLSTTFKPFFTATPKSRSYRQTTYVFFASVQPAPSQSVLVVRTDAGKPLGRFVVSSFSLDKHRTPEHPANKF